MRTNMRMSSVYGTSSGRASPAASAAVSSVSAGSACNGGNKENHDHDNNCPDKEIQNSAAFLFRLIIGFVLCGRIFSGITVPCGKIYVIDGFQMPY